MSETRGSGSDDGGRREVVVPNSLFRVVVVFSTLIAILTVIVGFSLLDSATRVYENPDGAFFGWLLQALFGLPEATVEAHGAAIALVVALFGLGSIALGVWVYAIGTRFRTGEMETPKDDADEDHDNG